jgi:BlaI family transcriptional regulator, penicillinase repressor
MPKLSYQQLSRRERQIMDVLYRDGRASAAQVRAQMPAAPSYSAVRAFLRILEEKGCIRHEADGNTYIFSPVVPRDTVKRSALGHLVRTFFGGSAEQAVAALLTQEKLSAAELDRLAELIEQTRREEAR